MPRTARLLQVAAAALIAVSTYGCDLDSLSQDTIPAHLRLPVPLRVATDQSAVNFQILRSTAPHELHFEQFHSVLILRGHEPIGLVVDVATGSLVSPHEELTEHVLGPGLLDTRQFPTARFESSSIMPLADDEDDATHALTGTLTMRGTSREVSFPGTFEISTQSVTTRADLAIRASDFGLSSDEMGPEMVLDEVTLSIELVFEMVHAPPT